MTFMDDTTQQTIENLAKTADVDGTLCQGSWRAPRTFEFLDEERFEMVTVSVHRCSGCHDALVIKDGRGVDTTDTDFVLTDEELAARAML